MNIKKITLTVLMLALAVAGSLVMAQQDRTEPASRSTPIEVAELEKLSSQPSLEQAIFKVAAEKLRQEKTPMTTAELVIPVRVRKVMRPNCYYQVCVNVGTKWEACEHDFCPESTK